MADVAKVGVVALLLSLPAACRTQDDKFFDAGGARLRYQVSGEGPPVVLLHGFGEALEIWREDGVVASLSPHFQVISLDVRGHGRSSKPDTPDSYGRELSKDVVRLLEHLDLTTTHVVGYSMGGLIALDLAVSQQSHVRSVVLGGTGWPPSDAIDNLRQQADAFERGMTPVAEGNDGRALAALLRSLRALSEEDVRSIKVPLLALVGADDNFLPHAFRLSGAVPTTDVVMIPGANHRTARDHPEFAQELLTWLLEQES